jgi:hypothetical protein
MSFNSVTFDSFYPDEEGIIEARKRLIGNAYEANVDIYTEKEWIAEVMSDAELKYYTELIGGPDYLHHIAKLVWNPLLRE